MARFRATMAGNVPFTAQEEIEADAEDALNLVNELPVAKAKRKAEMKAELDTLLSSTNTYTTAEGWVLDARRSDLDNLKNYRDYMIANAATTADVRLHDNSMASMTIARLGSLVGELIASGLGMYQHKWAREAQIDACATMAEVNAVMW